MFSRLLAVLGIVSFIGLIYVVNTTTPSNGGAMTVLSVFVLSYVALVSALTFFIFWTNFLIRKVFYSEQAERYKKSISFRHSYYYASVFAMAPVILISLKSVGKSGLIEWVLVAFFLILGCVYVSRQTN